MYTTVMKITPDMAKEMLAKNHPNNRPLNMYNVNQISQDIKNGRWMLNGETICFNESGFLVDGQNRLTAIAKTGIPVDVNVTFGVSDDVTLYDVGAKRTDLNVLQMGGVNATTLSVGIYRFLCGKHNYKSTRAATSKQIPVILDGLKEAERFVRKKGNNIAILAKSAVGAAVWVFLNNGYDKVVIERFCEIAATGFYSSENETAAIALRNYILENRDRYGQNAMNNLFAVACKALFDYTHGRSRTRPYRAEDCVKVDYYTGTAAEQIIVKMIK